MEENKYKELEEIDKKGVIRVCTALAIGYVLGKASIKQISFDSYRKGVSDTLSSMIIRKF